MPDMDDLQRRLDALEMRVAFQDQTIEDLNAAVTAQWKELDLMRRFVAGLGETVKDMELAARASAGKEPPPPHY